MSDPNDGMKAEWANKDYYAELGLKKGAAAAEIKKAYKTLAKDNHPDTHPGDDARLEKFKAVAAAYDVIGDAERRKKYDEMRSLYGSGAMPGGFGGRGGGGHFDDAMRPGGGFGDMFGDLFGGGGQRRQQRARPQRGADVETTTTIGFTDALDGVTVSLRLTSDAPCPDCSGTGGKAGTTPHACPQCGGSGAVTVSVGGGFAMNETCPGCGGRQLVYDDPCPTCRGSGHGLSARTIQSRIPAGVKDGQRIRLKGKGAAGQHGGPAGDLFVVVRVRPDRIFGRKGDDLTLDVPVTFAELALGADIKIPTLGGAPVTIKVAPGTPNGRTLRIAGRGVKKSDGTSGYLLATLDVQVPAELDDTARQALEAYRAATSGELPRASLFQ